MSHHSNERVRAGDPSLGRVLFIIGALLVIAGLLGAALGASTAGQL